jgi:uncharacterized iron-regulated membrane protein
VGIGDSLVGRAKNILLQIHRDLATIAVLGSGLYLWLSRRPSLAAEVEAELMESRMPAQLISREAAE